MKKYIVFFLTFAVLFTGCGGEKQRTVRTGSDDGSYTIQIYDADDVRIRTEYYTKDDVPTMAMDYRREGTRMAATYYNTDGSIRFVHEYNGKEVCTKTTQYTRGEPEKYGLYTYDSYGTRLTTTWYDMAGVKLSMQEFENSFDLWRTTVYHPDCTVKKVYDYSLDKGYICTESGM